MIKFSDKGRVKRIVGQEQKTEAHQHLRRKQNKIYKGEQ